MKRLLSTVVAILLLTCLPSVSVASNGPGDNHGKHRGQLKEPRGKAAEPAAVPDISASLPLFGIGLAGIAAVVYFQRRK